jgi:DNA polymerase I-like protein with 3'-5' exonuclease and polymerase domains
MDAAGITYGRTNTGQPQIDADLLKSLGDHPVAVAIKDAKRFHKVRTTFGASIRRHAINGRIHCTFNQLRSSRDNGDSVGAGPGRLSCTDPNLQQQPSKGALGKMWRSIFLPDEGGEWAAIDLKSQEPRMTVHFAYLAQQMSKDGPRPLCRGADVAWKMYQDNPNTDFHAMTTRMAFPPLAQYDIGHPEFDTKRAMCKAIFLGLVYSMGGGKLCRTLGYPTVLKEIRGTVWPVAGPQGQQFLDKFHSMVPWLKDLVQLSKDIAAGRGYIVTILGRRCRLAQKGDERKSLNNAVQGSSADQVKKAMVLLDAAGYPIQLQEHDEVDTTIYERKTAREMAHIIEHAVELTVPSVCDIEVGPSWGQSMGSPLT